MLTSIALWSPLGNVQLSSPLRLDQQALQLFTPKAAFLMRLLTMETLNRVHSVVRIKSLLQPLIPFVSLETYLLINLGECAFPSL